ncbi:MAG: response regulator [Chitinispirillaceae bacterium]|jgi:DNA-binding response OmpR family regulator|nr:response regulator [Chitinispirillaceae bacterium]
MNTESAGSILIVDDNPTNIQMLGAVLKTGNYTVSVAMSGAEALQFLEKILFDVILLDVMMPEMDGYEVCRTLKRDDRLKAIPVIFLTAKTDTDDIVNGFKAGAIDYVTKPFQAEELLARVAAHVEIVRSRTEIKKLKSFLPICAGCKSIRNDEGYWRALETYLSENAGITFSHGLCPECKTKLYPELDE